MAFIIIVPPLDGVKIQNILFLVLNPVMISFLSNGLLHLAGSERQNESTNWLNKRAPNLRGQVGGPQITS